jgi:hypothetical protein
MSKLLVICGDPVYFPEISESLKLNPDELAGLPKVIENFFSLAANKKPCRSFSVVGCCAPPYVDHELIVNALTSMNHCLEVVVFDAQKPCDLDELLRLAEEQIISTLSNPLDGIDPIEFKLLDDSILSRDVPILVDAPDFGHYRRHFPAKNLNIPVNCRSSYRNVGFTRKILRR